MGVAATPAAAAAAYEAGFLIADRSWLISSYRGLRSCSKIGASMPDKSADRTGRETATRFSGVCSRIVLGEGTVRLVELFLPAAGALLLLLGGCVFFLLAIWRAAIWGVVGLMLTVSGKIRLAEYIHFSVMKSACTCAIESAHFITTLRKGLHQERGKVCPSVEYIYFFFHPRSSILDPQSSILNPQSSMPGSSWKIRSWKSFFLKHHFHMKVFSA